MVQVKVFTKEQWKDMSENAHLVVFGKMKPASEDRMDFVLFAVHEDRPAAYVTCRELDSETLYWQFGGAFPGTRSTSVSYEAYQGFLDWCKQRYKRVTFLVENTNKPMLKMAMAGGFKITGIRGYSGDILLEHVLEFSDEQGT